MHIPSLQAVIEAKTKLLVSGPQINLRAFITNFFNCNFDTCVFLQHVKKPDIKFTPKKKTGKAAKTTLKRKMIVKEGMRRRYFEEVQAMQQQELDQVVVPNRPTGKPKTVLDRFATKKPVKN